MARTKRYLNPAAKTDHDTVCTAIVTCIRRDRRISHPVGGLPICSGKLVFTDYHEFCSTLHNSVEPLPTPTTIFNRTDSATRYLLPDAMGSTVAQFVSEDPFGLEAGRTSVVD